ncbi:Ceramide very long chain fatty acid hydroxylase SCS7 [Neolecta irregularis DAH-3]|uniref:Ceramide very long chain fatty acid hydroxylase n=1 Tax=Neolecta irregularis (strain DAH-3) TaxID=1198029 RepID=A0A1U7LHB1_NEOID|nr:Ceramide very long chain fatty acid hydroxylase SCS7 [Neolecta irregularis DAH-3]|eukprot:OLL22045.1 Ceramide very long chain fatty acid hydroxylase SCS7 [Neolecta irregularis DAH-3]
MPSLALSFLSAPDIQILAQRRTIVKINRRVYDVTDFLRDHPGGGEIIQKYNCKDVQEIMKEGSSHIHSDSAYEVLEEYIVGLLSEDEQVSKKPLYEATGLSCEEDLSVATDPKKDFSRHRFLDLERPLLPQIWNSNFSKEFYLAQVHRPRHIAGGLSAPLMPYAWMEPLSKTPWWVVPIIWIPCVLRAVIYVCGLAFWTLLEYSLHRFLFHIDEMMPDHPAYLTVHFLLHGVHHFLPMDRLRLVMPPALFIALAAPIVKLAHFLFPYHVAWAIFAGGISGYIGYDLTHYFLHHSNLPAYWKNLKTYHLAHHYKNWELGYGVTSKFWDHVFDSVLETS